jgi:hypothetical protein
MIKVNVGSLPIFVPELESSEKTDKDEDSQANKGPKVVTKTIILPDGSYGTETIILDDPAKIQNSLQAD